MKPAFSLIIPVYNRPDELKDLLESLIQQTYKNFEVIVVEDGSSISSEIIAEKYAEKLNLLYFSKPNSGPGLSRNFGATHAHSDYFIFLDSDCVIPSEYMGVVETYIQSFSPDAFGGPDKFHQDFTSVQKAIGYAMSSFLTTGGIRGGKTSMEKFHPRSFNMGFTRKVFEATNGFAAIRFGEDIDLSIRIKKAGFNTALIADAFVYHKRRTDFKKFFKQVFNSGIARINLAKRHPGSLKLIHFIPASLVIYMVSSLVIASITFSSIIFYPLLAYLFLILIFSFITHKSFKLTFLSLAASIVQLAGYGSGFIYAFFIRIILGKEEFEAFAANFYK